MAADPARADPGSPAHSPAHSWIGEFTLVLFALKFGAFVGWITYIALGNASAADDFITGQLALTGETSKLRDYAAAIAFLLTSSVAFALAHEGLRLAARQLSVPTLSGFHRALLLANIPAALAVGQSIFNIWVDPELIAVSLGAEVALAVCLGVALNSARRSPDESPEASGRAFSWVLAVLLFAYIAGATVPSGWAAALSTLGLYQLVVGDIADIALVASVAAVVIATLGCAFAFALPDGQLREPRLQMLLLLTQGVLLLGLVKLAGSIAIVAETSEYVSAATPGAVLVLLVLGLVSIAHLGMMLKTLRHSRGTSQFWFVVTPVAVALLATLLKTSPDLPFGFLIDDYHTGEYVLPYWALDTWGMLPYKDLDPARGWNMLLHGLIAEEGLGGTYASYAYTNSQHVFLISLLMFIAIRPLVGTWGAFLLVVLTPIGPLSEIDAVLTAGFALLAWAYFSWTPTAWLLLWVVLGTLGVLFAPGQGGLMVLATLPLGAARAMAAFHIEPGRFAVAVLTLAVTLVFILSTPVGDAVLGAVRYAMEQSAINSQAYGIPWRLSLGQWEAGKGAFYEVARNSWLLVTVGIAVSAWVVFRSDHPLEEKRRFLVVAVPIIILGLLFVLRAWGRIDPGEWSRPGIASAWFVALLLPLLVFAVRRGAVSNLTILALVVAASMPPTSHWSFRDANAIQTLSSSALIDGADHAVPALGRFRYEADAVGEYAALKRYADSQLPPAAPFLNLTNRNSLYYILERPPALPAAAYNLANPEQQARVVRELAAEPPFLALADANSIRFDGGVLGLRANLLFRFVLENYRPVENSGAVWMLYDPSSTKDRDDADFALLDRAFMQVDLGAIPSAWGQAWETLSDKTQGEVRLDPGAALLNDVTLRGDEFEVMGSDPFAVMTVPQGADSAQWGLLVFDFACSASQAAALEVFWANEAVPNFTPKASVRFVAKSGLVVVPLDFAPRWVLGGQPSLVRIDLADPTACPLWSISRVRLSKRTTWPNSMP